MATRNLPHVSMPHWPRPAKGHPHHRDSTARLAKRFERSMDRAIVALIVILAIAMVYGLVTATGHPAYFEHYWTSVWEHTTSR